MLGISGNSSDMVAFMMVFVRAFVVGGGFCVLGQVLMNVLHLTPAHTMVSLVLLGVFLGAVGWWQPLVDFAGAGATTPIVNFGASLVKGAWLEFLTNGWIGLLTGIFEVTGAGVSAAIIFSFIAAIFFRPRF